jgi:hypothetical protein
LTNNFVESKKLILIGITIEILTKLISVETLPRKLVAQLGFPKKLFFTFDEIKIRTKFYPNLAKILMFRFPNFDFNVKIGILVLIVYF